ncbi:hypothetical protein CYLTODRAFT_460731 [Cylindrobasidium torrendii FP15055 ss-10]|uniref:Ribonuclease H1 N-terminal domain-containing protein n=1 Tax=Cylindrobasidium torrendii FP15055 ss-10 TaxID=1314674 RepID=A0A0D7AQA2_9AGAR|nr:hypothetical protein CYLTODRAFT_460731 [Cylindrobasidium torrendii FP15055 ss-10]
MNLSVYEVYTSYQTALTAWDYAQSRGLVGGANREPPPALATVLRPLDIGQRYLRHTPLVREGPGKRYYVVYRGHCRGIFDNWIEAGLSLQGLSNHDLPDSDPHDEFTTWAEAKRAFLSRTN